MYSSLIPVLVDEGVMPNCVARPKPAGVGMAPKALERGLSEVPRPNDEKGVAEKEEVLEYGYASLNFFAD